jgi:hypothetical protein
MSDSMSQQTEIEPRNETTPAAPKLSFWERTLSRHPTLSALQVRISQAFVENPVGSASDLATAAECSVSEVKRWRADPLFWEVLAELGDGAAIGKMSDVILRQALVEVSGLPVDNEARRSWVELGAKRAGNLRPDSAVAVGVQVQAGNVGQEIGRAVELALAAASSPPGVGSGGDGVGGNMSCQPVAVPVEVVK